MMQLVTKMLNEDRNHEIHNLIEVSASMGPPNHRGFIRGRDGPPIHRCDPRWKDDREDARKIWGFEQNAGGNPIDKGISLMYNPGASVRRRFKIAQFIKERTK
jgi:hypothetical protein